MDATGSSQNAVRRLISNIRDRLGDSAVVTHSQQANGASYGQGTHHTSYEVLPEYTIQGSGMTLTPENRRGGTSIWCGISDQRFEWWQGRITELD